MKIAFILLSLIACPSCFALVFRTISWNEDLIGIKCSAAPGKTISVSSLFFSEQLSLLPGKRIDFYTEESDPTTKKTTRVLLATYTPPADLKSNMLLAFLPGGSIAEKTKFSILAVPDEIKERKEHSIQFINMSRSRIAWQFYADKSTGALNPGSTSQEIAIKTTDGRVGLKVATLGAQGAQTIHGGFIPIPGSGRLIALIGESVDSFGSAYIGVKFVDLAAPKPEQSETNTLEGTNQLVL